MPQIRRIVVHTFVVVVSAALTLLGLVNPGVIARADIDPRPGAYLSEYLGARGYPFDWFLIEVPDGLELTLADRILTGWLAADFLLILCAAYAAIGVAKLIIKGTRLLRPEPFDKESDLEEAGSDPLHQVGYTATIGWPSTAVEGLPSTPTGTSPTSVTR